MDEERCKVLIRLGPASASAPLQVQREAKSTVLTLQEGKSPSKTHTFEFEHVLSGATVEVYEKELRPLVGSWLRGDTVTCLAYGAAGTGKTYTLLGSLGESGLVGLALRDAVGRAELEMSYLEIRNERIIDLLDRDNTRLSIAEDAIRGTYVQGLTRAPIRSYDTAIDLIRLGNTVQKQGKPRAHSSPSHSILTLYLHSAQLQFVHLAYGEAGSVSKSLLVLSACLMVLAKGKPVFAPYRESKLTRLLKDATAAVLIACVSPASAEDSLQTLKFAYRLERCRAQSSPMPPLIVDLIPVAAGKEQGIGRKILSELREIAADKAKKCRQNSEDWLYYQKLGQAMSDQLEITELYEDSEDRENDHSAALQDAQIRHLIQLSEQRNAEKDRAIGLLTKELSTLKSKKRGNRESIHPQRSAEPSPSRVSIPRLQLSSLTQVRKAHKEAKQSGETRAFQSCLNSARSLDCSSGPQSYR